MALTLTLPATEILPTPAAVEESARRTILDTMLDQVEALETAGLTGPQAIDMITTWTLEIAWIVSSRDRMLAGEACDPAGFLAEGARAIARIQEQRQEAQP